MLSQTSELSFQDDMLSMPDDTGDSPLSFVNRRQVAPANQAESQNITTTAPDPSLARRGQLDDFGRAIENSRFMGEIPEVIVAEEHTSGNDDFDLQVDMIVDKFGGLAIATAFYAIFKTKYKTTSKVRSLNPVYRQGKTLATAGIELGLIIYNLGYLPMVLATAIFSLALGFVTLPYWVYRQYFPKKIKENDKVYSLIGSEGWSKYAKTFLVFGMYTGEVVGNIVSFVMRGDFLRNIAIYGAIGSFGTFIVGLIAVPFINKFFNNRLIAKKDTFRNNYVRSGITFGIALGSVIGFVIGTIAFPGLGSLAGMAMCAAFGSVIGGIALGIYGNKITAYLQKKWKVKDNTDNSWDYATRNSSYLFGFIGAAIGFFVPLPGGALVGAALGTAIGGVVGWAAGFIIIRAARKISLKEDPAKTLPWTQRIANGTMLGSMLGATVGFLIGLVGGPAGAVLGGTLGYSLGATLGGVGFGFYDKTARKLVRHLFMGTTIPAETAPLLSPSVLPQRTPVTTLVSDSTPRANTAAELKPAPVTTISSPTMTNILLQQNAPSPRRQKPKLTIDTTNHEKLVHKLEAPFKNVFVNTPPPAFFKPRQFHQSTLKEMPSFSVTAIELKA
jgi:hypothetical protein